MSKHIRARSAHGMLIFCGIIGSLLIIRIILAAFGIPTTTDSTAVLFAVTDVFVAPTGWLFATAPTPGTHIDGAALLTLLGLLVLCSIGASIAGCRAAAPASHG